MKHPEAAEQYQLTKIQNVHQCRDYHSTKVFQMYKRGTTVMRLFFFLSALRQWLHKAYNLSQCVNMHAYNTHMHTYNTHTHMHAHLYVCMCRHTYVCVGTGTNRTVRVKDTVRMKYCVRRTCIADVYEEDFLTS